MVYIILPLPLFMCILKPKIAINASTLSNLDGAFSDSKAVKPPRPSTVPNFNPVVYSLFQACK